MKKLYPTWQQNMELILVHMHFSYGLWRILEIDDVNCKRNCYLVIIFNNMSGAGETWFKLEVKILKIQFFKVFSIEFIAFCKKSYRNITLLTLSWKDRVSWTIPSLFKNFTKTFLINMLKKKVWKRKYRVFRWE